MSPAGSLCEDCAHVKVIVSGRGSRFLLCRRSAADPRFPKYPPQPVGRCAGHAPAAKRFTLELLAASLAVCRLDPGAAVPEWARGDLVFTARTATELSVVCAEKAVPAEIRCERGWRCLRVAGTLDLAMVGVIALLTAPLAAAGVAVFVVSTFDTDYLLVRGRDVEAAVRAWEAAGHKIARP